MYSRLRSSETSRLSAKQILAHRFKETGDYIAKKLKEKYSENANDTGLNGMVMSRFYTVYSQSQDYFYSNNIGSIVNEASTPLVIRYNDVQTLLDLDEYLKRFYALEEYDKKITLLAEYYKFHKDIPRVFALPTSNFLNKFHDKKRKIEYQRIKLLLFEEAQKKNKKVAMNEDDNEIRLTDGDISDQSKAASLRDGDRSSREGEIDAPVNMKKVLPDNLMYSLYRAHDMERDLSQMSSDSTLRDLFSRLDANGSGLDDLSNLTNLNLDLDAINEKSMRDIIKKMDSMLSKIDSNMVRENDRTLPLKLKDKVKVKDFNVNINLNLRVLKEEKASPIVSKGGPSLKAGLGYSKPTFEEKRKTSDSIKLIQEIKDKFRKKAQPNQLATSKKGSIDKEYKIESDPYKGGLSGRRLGASSKDIQVTTSKTSAFNKEGFGKKSSIEVSKESPITIKATHPSLKIKNFDKGTEAEQPALALSNRPDSSRRINYEGLLAYTDRSHKRDLKLGYKEESAKKMPLTARDPTKSTTDFTKNKESEYILKGSAKSNSNMASKKKLSLGSTDSLNFKKKKFSLQTNTKVGTSEKAGIVERPLTGSSLAAMAYGTSSGIFLKRSVLSNGTQEDLMNSNKKIQPITKKPTNGSLSSRTHKPTMDNGSLFMNAQAEYQRQTTNSNLTRKTDQGFSSPNLNNPLLTKTRLSKPELHGLTAKKSRISLQPDTGDPSRALHSSGALTDRSTNKDSKLSQIGQKSNVLVRVNTTNLVQASKFTKHITQAPQTKTEEKEKSELGKKISSKLIIINEDKDRALSSKVPIDLLSGRTRKSAITLTESKQISKGTSKAQESDRYAPPKKEIKSILEEINLIKGKMDHSTERPSSTNKPRKSPLNRKPQY